MTVLTIAASGVINNSMFSLQHVWQVMRAAGLNMFPEPDSSKYVSIQSKVDHSSIGLSKHLLLTCFAYFYQCYLSACAVKHTPLLSTECHHGGKALPADGADSLIHGILMVQMEQWGRRQGAGHSPGVWTAAGWAPSGGKHNNTGQGRDFSAIRLWLGINGWCWCCLVAGVWNNV